MNSEFQRNILWNFKIIFELIREKLVRKLVFF